MPLVPFQQLFSGARDGGYALGYFEAWNLESFQAVVQAAEEERSPVIAGFNGGFLRHHGRQAPEPLAYYSSLRHALEYSTVPVGFLLNESDDLDQIKQAIELGFNGVMPESDGVAADLYHRLVCDVVDLAHSRGVFVEAQVGELPTGAPGQNGNGRITDPEEAYRFVSETNIDALGVAVGNVHILTRGKASIDLDALRRLRERIEVPLVLHGGTSIPLDAAQELVDLGVLKLNFGTNLKQSYLRAVAEALGKYAPPASPHPFLGLGGSSDIMIAGREAVKETVKKTIRQLGSSRKAG